MCHRTGVLLSISELDEARKCLPHTCQFKQLPKILNYSSSIVSTRAQTAQATSAHIGIWYYSLWRVSYPVYCLWRAFTTQLTLLAPLELPVQFPLLQS